MSEQKILDQDPNVVMPPEISSIDSGVRSLVRSLRFAFLALIVIIIGTIVYFFTLGGYVAIPPQEAVVVLRFGAYHGTYERGPHWFFPYPVNQFIRIPTAPQTIKVEYLAEELAHGQSARSWLDSGIDSYLLTNDTNIIHTAWSFNYIVTEPKVYYEKCMTPVDPRDNDERYRYNITPPTGRGPQTMLKALFDETVVTVTANMSVDDVITKQSEYSSKVFDQFAKSVLAMEIGVVIDSVTLDRVEPPSQTLAAFQDVASAGTTSDSYIAEAESYAIRTVSQAEGQANQILANAESYKLEVVSRLRSESIYFNSIQKEYEKSGNTILVALYNEVVGEALASVHDKYLLGTGAGELKQLRMKLNPEPLVSTGQKVAAMQAAAQMSAAASEAANQ